MNYYEFTQDVKNVLRQKLSGRDITIQETRICKANDNVREGILLVEDKHALTPAVYLDDYYRSYREGVSIEEVAEHIIFVHDNSLNMIPLEYRDLEDFSKARSRITFKLLNTTINEEYLQDAVTIPFLDLSVVFYYTIIVGAQKHVYSIKVSPELMKTWNVTEEELFVLARTNTERMLGVCLREADEVIREMLENEWPEQAADIRMALDDRERTPMYILTNIPGTAGAVMILAENVLKNLAQKLEDDLYIIPSSIHEVLLLPVHGRMFREAIDEMITDINRRVLQFSDILSNHVYLYLRESDQIVM